LVRTEIINSQKRDCFLPKEPPLRGIDLKDLFNVQTFMDHNRIWAEPKHISKNRISQSTGAFAHRGKRASTNLVEEKIVAHFDK
jgi:hypothetical protein